MSVQKPELMEAFILLNVLKLFKFDNITQKIILVIIFGLDMGFCIKILIRFRSIFSKNSDFS